MQVIFKKEDLLKPTKLFQSLGTMGILNEFDEVIVCITKSLHLASDPDPLNLNLITVFNYNIAIKPRLLKNSPSPFDITEIRVGDKKVKYFISETGTINLFAIKNDEMGDITIEWIDLQEERSNKLDELGI
jgi:hypothetical protein